MQLSLWRQPLTSVSCMGAQAGQPWLEQMSSETRGIVEGARQSREPHADKEPLQILTGVRNCTGRFSLSLAQGFLNSI